MHSMTGFGRGTAPLAGASVVVEIKTVNHRYLEMRVRAPKDMLAAEAMVEQKLRQAIGRGYCTVAVELEGEGALSPKLDPAALRRHLSELSAVAAESGLELRDLTPLLGQATDLFCAPSTGRAPQLLAAAVEACDRAIAELLVSRKVEGATVAAAMAPILASLTEKTAQVEALAKTWPALAKQKLEARLAELLSERSVLEPGRLEQEAALAADRSDITEELSRLAAHLKELERLHGADEPIGRRIEFLLQEIGREINTTGSKAALQRISSYVIDMKSDLDKLRELVANVE